MCDQNTSDEDDEITCELQAFPQPNYDEELALDWSVSCISAASGFDPDRFHSEVSSSNFTSPEKSVKNFNGQRPMTLASDDLKRLAGSVKDLQFNLDGISKMSISPRREKIENKFDSPLGETAKNRTGSVDLTPPVRDPGPGNGTIVRANSVQNVNSQPTKLDQMKNTLKQLEEARRKYNVSKIPRRSLNFTETSKEFRSNENISTKQDQSKSSQNSGSSQSNETESDQMNKLWVQSSKNSGDSEKTVIENTIIANKDNNNSSEADNTLIELTKRLNQELHNKKMLESELQKLHSQVQNQEKELLELKSMDSQKEKLLQDLKVKWTEVAKTWSQQLHQSQDEVSKLKAENQAAKQQFFVCEEELSKALQLASDFKQKIDEEESMKQDILTQLLAERSTKATILNAEKEKNKQLSDANQRLQNEVERLKKVENEVRQNFDLLHEKFEKCISAERTKSQDEIKELHSKVQTSNAKVASLENELKTTQSSMHTFYVSQMESIMSEKISLLQKNVAEWEKTMNEDKERELNQLKKNHDEELENMNKKFSQSLSDLQEHSDDLEASLNAARREADALREQLQLHEKRKPTSNVAALPGPEKLSVFSGNDSDWASLLFQQSIPRLHNNLRGSNLKTDGDTVDKIPTPSLTTTDDEEEAKKPTRPNPSKRRPASASQGLMVMNNLRQDKATSAQEQKRPSSVAAYNLTVANRGGSALESGKLHEKSDNKESSLDDTTSLMSVNEKKEIVTSFIRQFLQDHPESVLDTSFLASLNEMACKLIQESFRVEDSEDNESNLKGLSRQGHPVTYKEPVSNPQGQKAKAVSSVPNNLLRETKTEETKKKNRKTIWK